MKKNGVVFVLPLLSLATSSCFFTPKRKELYRQSGNEKFLRVSIPLKNGVPEGTVQTFNARGEVIAEQFYKQGMKEGPGKLTLEDQTNQERYEYNYLSGQLNGPILHLKEGKEIAREEYHDGLPAKWASLYQNPFSPKAPGTFIQLNKEVRPTQKIYCGWIKYEDEKVQSDSIEIEKTGATLKISRLYSEAFTFEPNFFEADETTTPDSNQFTHFHFTKGIFSDREGELNLRLFLQQKKTFLQGYGYLKKKPVPLTKAILSQDDSHLLNLFGLKFEADLVDRSGFQKIELECNRNQTADRTDYSHEEEEEQ